MVSREHALLEQQWANQAKPRILHVSRGFEYSWDAQRPPGERVLAETMRLNGRPVLPDSTVRLTVNSFLAAGGDNFTVLKLGSDARTGVMDIDAFEAWFQRGDVGGQGSEVRIRRLN